MMRGLLLKAFWEVSAPALWFGAALMFAMALLTYIVPQLQEQIGQALAQLPFAKTMIAALLGIDVDQALTAEMLQAFVWVHPVVLTIVWAHEILFCTRLPGAEIDHGTIDFLLGLPVSRCGLYVSESLMWLVSGLAVFALGAAGHLYSARRMSAETWPGLDHVLLVLFNLYCVYLAVGGVTYLVSACQSSRGPAIAMVFALLLASFLLTFLARFWKPAEQVAFLSVLNYYQPARLLSGSHFPWRDCLVLITLSAVAWLTGYAVFARRNIATV